MRLISPCLKAEALWRSFGKLFEETKMDEAYLERARGHKQKRRNAVTWYRMCKYAKERAHKEESMTILEYLQQKYPLQSVPDLGKPLDCVPDNIDAVLFIQL